MALSSQRKIFAVKHKQLYLVLQTHQTCPIILTIRGKSELFACNASINGLPIVITNSAPLIVEANFHSALPLGVTPNQTKGAICAVVVSHRNCQKQRRGIHSQQEQPQNHNSASIHKYLQVSENSNLMAYQGIPLQNDPYCDTMNQCYRGRS